MDWSLFIFIFVTGLFAWRGFRGGFVKALGRVLAMLAAYATAILFGGPLADWLEVQFGLLGLVALGAASLALFIAGGLAVTLVFALLRRYVFRGDDVSTASAIGGGFVGSLVGVLIAIAIVWSYAFARDMWSSETVEVAAARDRSGVETLANRFVGGAANMAINAGSEHSEAARLTGVLMSAPAEVVQRGQRLARSPEFQQMIQDPGNRQALDSGQPELVQRLPAFRTLLANPDLREIAEIAGYDNVEDIEVELARQLIDVWARSQRLKNHPRVQQIIADPEFQAALDSNDPVAVLTNARLLELADIIFADENPAPASNRPVAVEPRDSVADAPVAPAEPTRIYQWTDSSGRIHFSDQRHED